MAVIHITEAEATRDFAGLLAKVRAGEEVRIADASRTIAVIRPMDEDPPHRLMSEILRLSDARGSNLTLDDQFGNDLEAIIGRREQEALRDPWV